MTTETEDWSRLPGAVVPFNWPAFWQKHRILLREQKAYGAILSSLASRLGFYAAGQTGWALDALVHPGWKRTRMAPPIFILGHQRSGTTLLHRLLSEDRAHARSLLLHEMVLPAITTQNSIARVGRWDSRHGGWIGRRFQSFQQHMFAPLDYMHRLRLDEIEEDEFVLWGIYASTMVINDSPLNASAKSLEDLRDFHRWPVDRQIRALGWYRATLLKKVYRSPTADGSLPWIVSKNPHFSQKIPELMRVFPDARIVYLVRNPLETIASRLDLIRGIWRHRFKGFRDMTKEQAESIVKDSLRTYLNAERDLYDVPEAQRMIVHYDELLTHIPETVHRIYEQFGLPGPDEHLTAKLAEIRARKRHVSEHKYDLEEFGVDPAELRRELEPVFRNHDLDARAAAFAQREAAAGG
ncbi:MAG: sulfotransferase family protein [Bauldia sp.]